MSQPDIYDLLAEADSTPPAPRRSSTAPVCDRCGRTHTVKDDSQIVGLRFDPKNLPHRYRARYDGSPIRTTREQAMQDMCDHRAAQTATRGDQP